jgi:hypothetical protein
MGDAFDINDKKNLHFPNVGVIQRRKRRTGCCQSFTYEKKREKGVVETSQRRERK